MIKNLLLCLGICSILIYACEKIEPVDPAPEIKFKSLEIEQFTDTFFRYAGELVFSFVDGDGDIGLFEYDTLNADSSYKYNLFLFPYSKIDTQYIEIDISKLETPPFYRIWYDEKMNRVSQNKTLKGDIKLDLQFPEERPYNSDTIRYEFYMIDRAGNKSNVEVTSDIGF